MSNKRPASKITYGGGGSGNRSTLAAKRRQIDVIASTDESIDMSWVPDTLTTEPLIPKRPGSQAAAMASEPSKDLIDTVTAFTGCSPRMAARVLKVKNNSTEAACNALFDGEDISKLEKEQGWDEEMMRELQPLGNSAAPTRGNSPAPSMQPNNQMEEDRQMAAALAASQETGTIAADGTSTSRMIGPSTRNDHHNQWAMVRYGAQEVLADVDISQRLQAADAVEPRFLKHLSDGDYTPNLLTICHSIPAVREAFLMKSWVRDDYGNDDGWWRGQPIPTPTVVHVADGSPVGTLTDRHEEVIAEVQRLTAFLDASDRVYASTGGLTETKMIKEHNLSDATLLELFLKTWTAAAETKDPAASSIFTTKMATQDRETLDTPYKILTEITVPPDQSSNPKQDLAELLDEYIWDRDLAAKNFIDRPADVFVLNLKQDDPKSKQVGVEIPASIHIDRFLEENIASSSAVRDEMVAARYKITKIEGIENKLTTWSYYDSQKARKEKERLEPEQKPKEKSDPGPKVSVTALDESDWDNVNAKVNIKDVLTHSIAHFSGDNRKDADATDYPPAPYPPEFSETAAKLDRIMRSIEEKLRLLHIHKAETRSLLSKLSKHTPSEQAPKHRYTLRGVATKPHITYVLRPKGDEDVEMDGQDSGTLVDVDDTTPPGMQWWRISYETNGSTATIQRTKSADYDVLRAAELEHNSCLLVYASDRAVSVQPSDLPKPLQRFIERDNESLARDVVASQRDRTEYAYFDNVRDSIEPGERRGSGGSMDNNGGHSPSPEVQEIHLDPIEGEMGMEGEMLEREGARGLLTRGTMNGSPAVGDVWDRLDENGEGMEVVEDREVRMEE